MHPIVIRSLAGDAGPLTAPPAMAERFRFWRGQSGRRYACTVFTSLPLPAFEQFVALYVKREGQERTVVAVGTMKDPAFKGGFDEVHIHLTGDGDALATAIEDLTVLAKPAPREIGTFSKLPVFAIGGDSSKQSIKRLQPCGSIQLRAVTLFKRAANHSNVASRIPSVSNSFTVAST
jgi:hypothetical protein